MKEMTTRERIVNLIEKKPVDRVPIVDVPWITTLKNWGLGDANSENDWRDYLG